MREIFEESIKSIEAGESAAVVTIIQGSAPWTTGAKMLVRHDGVTIGSLGEERLSSLALGLAQKALLNGHARRVGYLERDGALVEASPYETSAVELFVQVLQPSPTLLLVGAGHIGEALVRQAKQLKWRVLVVDDRPDFLRPERLADADERILVGYEPSTEMLDPIPITVTPSMYIVVATWGWDQPALRQLVQSPAACIGLVASARKGIIIFRELLAEGIPLEALARVRVPCGLDLGSETPEEIALSIMAELLLVARGATGQPLMQIKGGAVMKQAEKLSAA